MPVPLPAREAERLEDLQRYRIVETPPEPAFDRITALTARLFRVPIVVLNFLSQDSQWFKSCIGLNCRTTSREVSFCAWAILGSEIMIIPDATLDDRFVSNPFVTPQNGIRFYAGAPLLSDAGHNLGTLCILDTVPRPAGLTEDEKCTLQDLAALAMSELELRSSARKALDIEEKLQTTNRNLEKVASELRRSNEDLQAFAHIVSHDLQSPLRTVLQFTQLLERRARQKLDSEETNYIRFVTESAMRMQQLIVDLLNYSRVASELQVNRAERVSAETVLQLAIANAASLIKETQAVITFDRMPEVTIDSSRLLQVFQNLICNAMAYAEADPPRIHVAADACDEVWRFSVQDNGIGIDPQYHARIFEPFQRLHASERSGSGLGLSVCKKIVERSGGRLWVDSQPGCGSTFFFTLPKHAPDCG